MPQFVSDDVYVGSLDETAEIGAMYGLDPEEAEAVRARVEAMGGDFKAVMRRIGKGIKRVAKRVKGRIAARASKAASAASAAVQEPEESAVAPVEAAAAPAINQRTLLLAGVAAVALFIFMRKKGR